MTMKFALTALAATLLSGCVSLLPDPPPAPFTYTMRSGAVERVTAAQKPLVIVVGAPSAQRLASGSDIVWRQGAEVAVMDRVAWDDAAPDLLQMMLVETLDKRGAFRAAVRSGSGARGDVELRWDLLAFEIVEDAKLEAVLTASVRMIDSKSRAVVETQRFETRTPIASRSGKLAAAALEQAARDASLQIADWAAEKAPLPSPPPVVSVQPSEATPSQPSAASTRR